MADEKKNILVVDDESKITEVLASYLESRGYAAFTAASGAEALSIFAREHIALVLLDLMLPDLSGEAVCRMIRSHSRVPIIMLTAKVAEQDMVGGLSLGADDYVTKPFSLKALAARIEAVLRRANGEPLLSQHAFHNGDLTVDLELSIVKKRQHVVSLTPSELRILSALIRFPGKVFTRNELIELALGSEFDGYDRAIDSHIKNLRQKIEDNPKSPIYVRTIHGLGYKFGGDGT